VLNPCLKFTIELTVLLYSVPATVVLSRPLPLPYLLRARWSRWSKTRHRVYNMHVHVDAVRCCGRLDADNACNNPRDILLL
jgi:hypothetical protein